MSIIKEITIYIITMLLSYLILKIFTTEYEINDVAFKVAHWIFCIVFLIRPLFNYYLKKITDLMK